MSTPPTTRFGSRAAALARFYDLEYRDYAEDSDFYVQYAHALDSERKLPILELGCGTGRLLSALSEAGFNVTGIDTSPEMLELARQRLENIGTGTARQVDLVCADMRHLEGKLGGPFNMAFCALNTFAYLLSSEEQLAMLRGLVPLLVTHGILILDLTPPFPHFLSPDDGNLILQGTFYDKE
ncbi:MAG: methyltransferase domain-containing protein [Chloroflexia bacterium]